MPPQTPQNRTNMLLLAMLVVIIAGIASRLFRTGFLAFDKYLGDALYAVLIYILLSLVWNQGSSRNKAVSTMVFMAALELFQLTQIPYHLSESSSQFLRMVAVGLGTRFGWLDLAAYLIGVVVIAFVDHHLFAKVFPVSRRSTGG